MNADGNDPTVETMEALVAANQEDGLLAALLDVDGAAIVTDILVKDFGFKKIYVVCLLQVLTPFLRRMAREGGGKALDLARTATGKCIRRLPNGEIILDKLREINNRWDERYRARQQFREVLHGTRTTVYPEFSRLLEAPLQANLEALARIDTTFNRLGFLQEYTGNRFDRLESFVNPQPPLHAITTSDAKDRDRLIYTSRFIPFVGREQELRILADFLEGADSTFSWMIVEGPGGAGKSRLALEFCLHNMLLWQAAFFKGALADFDFNTWEPDRDTLMVLDYAGNRAGLREILSALAARQPALPYRVRLLLLERDRPERQDPAPTAFSLNWVRDLLGADSDTPLIEQARHTPEPIALRDLGDVGLRRVMAVFLADASQEQLDTHLEQLRTIDPEGRPLLAALYAMFMAEDGRERPSKEEVVAHALRREKGKYFRPRGPYACNDTYPLDSITPDEALLALATCCGGLSWDTLAPLGNAREHGLRKMTEWPEIDTIDKEERFARLGGHDGRLPPLQPDLLGEYLILETVRYTTRPGQAVIPPGEFMSRAWRLNPDSTAETMGRMVQDYPDNPMLPALLDPQALPTPASSDANYSFAYALAMAVDRLAEAKRWQQCLVIWKQSYAWGVEQQDARGAHLLAMAATNAINRFGNADKLPEAEEFLHELRTLAEAHPDSPDVQEVLAVGLVNAIGRFGVAGKLPEAEEFLHELRSLAKAHPDNSGVQVQLAKGLFNHFDTASNAGDWKQAISLLDELRTLAKAHPGNPGVQEVLARGLFNHFDTASNAGDWEQAASLLHDLRTLAKAHPDNPEVQEQLAKGLTNAISRFGGAGKLAEAMGFMEELRLLAKGHPDNPGMQEALAMGLFNQFYNASNAGDWEQATPLLDDLRTLGKAHPGNPGVQELLAKGLVNAIADFGGAGKLPEAEEFLDNLRTLAKAHPDNPGVQELLAKGLTNAIADFGGAGMLDEAKAFLNELRTLAEAHPDNPVMQEALARGLFNHFDTASNAGDWEQAASLLHDLRTLAKAHPDNPEVQEQLAKGLTNAISRFGGAGKLAEAMGFMEELRLLAKGHPDNPDVQELLAMGLFNQFNNTSHAGDWKQAASLLHDLRLLAERHPDNPVMQEQFAKGLVNAIADFGGAGKLDEAKAFLNELRTLAEAHPDNPDVQERLAKGLVNRIHFAVKAGEQQQAEVLWEELQSLCAKHPDNPGVLEVLAHLQSLAQEQEP